MEIIPVTNFNEDIAQSAKIFPKQFVFLLTAQSKGGKTTVIANCLKNKESGWQFEPNNIYLFSKTGMIDDNFARLRKKMRKYSDDHSESDVNLEKTNIKTQLTDKAVRSIFIKRYNDWITYKNDDTGVVLEPPPILIIIDDFLGNRMLRDQNGALCVGIPVCRHMKISFVISSQTYKSIHPIIRKNASHFMVGQINNISEIRAIAEEQSYVLPPRWLISIYLQITKKNDYSFLFIDTTKPLDRRFRKSFGQYIAVPNDETFING